MNPHGPVGEQFMRHYYGASGYVKPYPIEKIMATLLADHGTEAQDLAKRIARETGLYFQDAAIIARSCYEGKALGSSYLVAMIQWRERPLIVLAAIETSIRSLMGAL